MKAHKTILATTYAVNPYKGSEDGMGWNFVCQIARFHKVIAITRKNNKKHIEKYMKEHPDELYNNIHFLYFDLPPWQRFWKKGSRGAMLYFWLWQRQIIPFIKKQDLNYDIVHNLNFHNDWVPSYLWKLKRPFVWGPIGHHSFIPKQYLKPFSIKYSIKDRLKWLVKWGFWNVSGDLKKTIKKADFILVMNSAVANHLNLKNKRTVLMPSVASEDFGYSNKTKKRKFTLISVGRLAPLKGFDLSILAFASFLKKLTLKEKEHCELIIVGSGSQAKKLKLISEKYQMSKYIKFIDWMERKSLMELYKGASVFLFPSHEGAGMVVSEALSFGLPIICLDNSGPGEFIDDTCGIAVKHQNYFNTVNNLGEAIFKIYQDPKLRLVLSKGARLRFIEKFHWDRRGVLLNSIYLKL